MTEIDEIVQTIEHLQREFEDLAIRGLRTCGPEHLAALNPIREQFDGIGASYLAERTRELIQAIENDDRRAAAALLRAQSVLRTFERVLTLEVTEHLLASANTDDSDS